MPKPVVVAVLGSTATGKSALALVLAERFDGEIVNCDSTAVYRGFDIGTDKLPADQHEIFPTTSSTSSNPDGRLHGRTICARCGRCDRGIHRRGRVPILAGGTGFYYRALTRGLFPGPGRDDGLRRRLEGLAERRGVAFLHRMLRASIRRRPGASSRAI